MARQELSLIYGDVTIPYNLNFTNKKPDKISIHVHHNGDVQVNAPTDASLQQIKQAVYKRARWIFTHYSKARDYSLYALPREYVSGESCYYLGRQFVLKIYKVSRQPESVKLNRGQLQVRTKNNSKANIRTLVTQWYREHAINYFDKRLNELVADLNWVQEKPECGVLSMKKQWGSCSPSGKILLNPALVKASRDCIDYVILHELCHLIFHNHNKDFYKLLSQTLPEWKIVKDRLDMLAEVLLNE